MVIYLVGYFVLVSPDLPPAFLPELTGGESATSKQVLYGSPTDIQQTENNKKAAVSLYSQLALWLLTLTKVKLKCLALLYKCLVPPCEPRTPPPDFVILFPRAVSWL